MGNETRKGLEVEGVLLVSVNFVRQQNKATKQVTPWYLFCGPFDKSPVVYYSESTILVSCPSQIHQAGSFSTVKDTNGATGWSD